MEICPRYNYPNMKALKKQDFSVIKKEIQKVRL